MSVQYPTRDTKYPPNETLAARRLWELATRPEDGVIPAGTLFVERWSNGHYGPPETNSFELLTTDNIGPGFTCERRVLVPADPHRPLTADDITDEIARALATEEGYEPPWEQERHAGLYRERAAAVLPIIRKAQADALRDAAREEFQLSPNVHYQGIRVHERLVKRADRIEKGTDHD